MSSAKAYTGRAVLYARHSALRREMRSSAKDCDYQRRPDHQPPSPNNSVQDMTIVRSIHQVFFGQIRVSFLLLLLQEAYFSVYEIVYSGLRFNYHLLSLYDFQPPPG